MTIVPHGSAKTKLNAHNGSGIMSFSCYRRPMYVKPNPVPLPTCLSPLSGWTWVALFVIIWILCRPSITFCVFQSPCAPPWHQAEVAGTDILLSLSPPGPYTQQVYFVLAPKSIATYVQVMFPSGLTSCDVPPCGPPQCSK